jgi:hypothetical protein
MKIAIIALILSIAALGLAGFATFVSLRDDESTPVAESGWSEEECKEAKMDVGANNGQPGVLLAPCILPGSGHPRDCAPYNSMLQAINDNCP